MLQQLWNGLTLGALYGLIALGYTLVFGIIQVVFFAQGELSMLAAFAALAVVTSLGPPSIGTLLLGLLAAIVVSVSAGVLAERIAIRPLRGAPRVLPLITSLGVSIVFQNLVMIAKGPQPFPFRLPDLWRSSLLQVHFSALEIVIVLCFGLCLAGIARFLKSPTGLAIRAVAQSRDGARLMGVSVDRTVFYTFVLSSTTAALAGVLMAAYYGAAKFDMGFVPGIKGFTIAILGGVGNIWGAAVAAATVGLLETLFAGYVSSDYKDIFVFALLVLTLAVRPKGLLGEGK